MKYSLSASKFFATQTFLQTRFLSVLEFTANGLIILKIVVPFTRSVVNAFSEIEVFYDHKEKYRNFVGKKLT